MARRVISMPGQAPPPPTGTAAGPFGALHASGAVSLACGLVRVVTNVVNRMAFSLKMLVFGLRLTTFVTGVLARRFELRWFDDVCNVGRPLVARPGPVATAQVSRPDLTCRIAETAPNFARNSPATVSNTEFRSLELQRFRTLLKLCPIELRARFRGSCSCRPRYFACNSLECVSRFEV